MTLKTSSTATNFNSTDTALPPSGTKIKVLIVDDHPITRHGLKTLINQQLSLEVCGETDNARDAVELVNRLRPALAVIDVGLKATSGLELTTELKALMPELRVLVVSMHEEALYAERALRAGAMGYVMKQDVGEKVTTAIAHLLRGEIYLSAKMKERMLHRFVNRKGEQVVFAMDTLSEREMEVFRLIGDGFGTRDIANKLTLSPKTIDSYREHLKLKLNLSTGAELIRHAIQWAKG